MTLMTATETAAVAHRAPKGQGEEFLRIGEMAKTFGVTLRALRFYEDKGLRARTRGGGGHGGHHPAYTRADRVRLKLICSAARSVSRCARSSR